MTISIRKLSELNADELTVLLNRKPQSDPDVIGRCRDIIESVRSCGDAAVIEYTRTYDAVSLTSMQLRVTEDEFDKAEESLAPSVARSIQRAIQNIERFHNLQQLSGMQWLEVEPGVWCGERFSPIESVCLYVPRGRGAFASVACMLGVPARIAGVSRVVVCTPPGPDGVIDAATLYALRLLKIDEVYRIGGAQAVAAVAYGTESIPQCDKIVGPGNVYVSAARRLLSDVIDPGSPAGPSESLIIADETPDPREVAWNLLIEAEHGENSSALLLTHVSEMAEKVAGALQRQLDDLAPKRREFASQVLSERGGIVVTSGLDESISFANRFAAEHVALMVRDPWSAHPRVVHAGEILFGDFPVISVANYAMGMNAILPTGGTARCSSPVSVRDFGKFTSLGFCTQKGFESLRPVVSEMSREEGFSAHHLAVEQWTKYEARSGST